MRGPVNVSAGAKRVGADGAGADDIGAAVAGAGGMTGTSPNGKTGRGTSAVSVMGGSAASDDAAAGAFWTGGGTNALGLSLRAGAAAVVTASLGADGCVTRTAGGIAT